MSASCSGSGDRHNLDTELNLVPIIDCFVMLICFLLFTAAFTQLVYLEAKITQSTAAAIAKNREELNKFYLEITIQKDGLSIKVEGEEVQQKLNETIPVDASGNYDLVALHEKMIAIKTLYPDRFSVDLIVKSKDSFEYQKLLQIMDSIRHLDEDEYKAVRIVGKKLKNLNLTSDEQHLTLSSELISLAESQLNNSIAANTDRKLLFPDIALVGVY